MDNPNTYDDDAYTEAVPDLTTVLQRLWDAGADLDNIREELSNALENVTGSPVRVEFFDA